MKPSLRLSAQRSLRAPFSSALSQLTVLAAKWNLEKHALPTPAISNNLPQRLLTSTASEKTISPLKKQKSSIATNAPMSSKESLGGEENTRIDFLVFLQPGLEWTSPSEITFQYYRTAKEIKEIIDKDKNINSQAQIPLVSNAHVKQSPLGSSTTSIDMAMAGTRVNMNAPNPSLNTTTDVNMNGSFDDSRKESPFSSVGNIPSISQHVVVNIPVAGASVSAVLETFTEAKKAHNISSQHSFELFHTLRLTSLISQPEYRMELVFIRLLSLTILAQIHTEEDYDSKILMYDPDLISKCAAILISKDAKDTMLVKTIVLYFLDSIARYRSHCSEVLSAVQCSAHHGHLIYLLRQLLDSKEGQEQEGEIELLEALFSFISFVFGSASGGNMLIAAGFVPILVSALETTAPLKTVAKCVSMLDNIQNGPLPSTAEIFNSRDGIAKLVGRIGRETQYVLDMKKGLPLDSFGANAGSMPDPGTVPLFRDLLERTPVLRSTMKLILHLMQSSGTMDGMRNLIDSSLPGSILLIFQNSLLFGAVGVYGLAINIMSTFVHNEPTCLSILQEQGLPSAFLDSAFSVIPVSPEVVSAFPNAFGAICLNSAGLDLFIERNPIDNFLGVFTEPNHLRSLLDNDVPHLVGNSMDELVRHHPATGKLVMKGVVDMVQRVVEIGEALPALEGESCELWVEGAGNQNNNQAVSSDINAESRMAQYLDVVARFLEGLFQNVAHCKEFISFNGLSWLLKLYSLDCIPYAFATSSSSASMSYLFRSIFEVNGPEAVPLIYKEIQKSYAKMGHLMSNSSNPVKPDFSQCLDYIRINSTQDDMIKNANSVFHGLISFSCYVRLLNDIYGSNSLSNTKSLLSLTELFSSDREFCLIDQFSRVSRVCVLEKIIMTADIPAAWYKPNKPSEKGKEKEKEEEKVEGWDSKVARNSKLLYHLLNDIPNDIILLFQVVLKILAHRRVTSVANINSAKQVTDKISKGLISCLDWNRLEGCLFQGQYFSVVISQARSLLCEESGNVSSLQTHFAFSLHQNGGMDVLCNLAASKIENAKDEIWQAFYDTIGDTFQSLVSKKYMMASNHTTTLSSRLRESFDSVTFLVSLRLRILPAVLGLFYNKIFCEFTNYGANRILGCILIIFKAEGEKLSASTPTSIISRGGMTGSLANLASQFFSSRLPISGSATAILPITGLPGTGIPSATGSARSSVPVPAPVVQPNPQVVERLVEMGFTRRHCERVSVRCNNNLNRAIDYILTNPDLEDEPEDSAAAVSISAVLPSILDQLVLPHVMPENNGSVAISVSVSGSGSGRQSDAIVQDVPGAMEVTVVALPVPDESAGNDVPRISTPSASGRTSDVPPAESEGQAGGSEDSSNAQGSGLSQSASEAIHDIDMAVDEPIEEDPASEVADTSPEEQRAEENRLAAQEIKDELIALRLEHEDRVLERCFSIIDQLKDSSMVFGIKELVCYLSKTDISKAVNIIQDHILKCHETLKSKEPAASDDAKKNHTVLYILYRLLALIVSDTNFQSSVFLDKASAELPHPFLDPIMHLLPQNDSCELWLAPLLLILEAYISYVDAPREVALRCVPALFDKPDVSLKEENGFSDDYRVTIVLSMIQVLSLPSLENDSLHVALRVLARLTSHWNIAKVFVEKKGISAIFDPENIGSFAARQSLVMMITRHCVEDPSTLQALMEADLKRLLSKPRIRNMDLSSFLKGSSHLVFRSRETFLAAVQNVCELVTYCASPNLKSTFITLAKEVAEGTKADGEPSNPLLEAAKDKQSLGTPIKGILPLAKELTDLLNQDMNKVTQHLTTQLIGMKQRDANDAKMTNSVSLCVYLQGLCELFCSYPITKHVFISASQKKPTKNAPMGKNQILPYLLTEVIPLDLVLDDPAPESTPEQTAKALESSWAVKFLVSLCYLREDFLEKQYSSQLQLIRVICIEAFHKALVDMIGQNKNLAFEIRYGKIVGLAKLASQILHATSVTNTFDMHATIEAHTLAISKIMIEKGFVGIFTSALADLDINHPGSPCVVAAILEPLDKLASAAVNVGMTLDVASNAVGKGKKTPSLFDNALHDYAAGTEETPNEISSMFRNSALGMLEPTMDDDESSDDDESNSDDELLEFSEEDNDEMDDSVSEEGSEGDDDMEIVIPQPFQGNVEDEDSDSESSHNDSALNIVMGDDGMHPGMADLEDEDMDGMDDDEDDDDDDDDEDDDGEDNETPAHRETESEGFNPELLTEENEFDADDNSDEDQMELVPTVDEMLEYEDAFGTDHFGGNGDNFITDDEMASPNRVLLPPNLERARRRFENQIFTMGPSGNGIELQWVSSGGGPGGRNPFISNPAPGAQDMTHPLLINHDRNRIGAVPASSGNGSGRSTQLGTGDITSMQVDLLDQLFSNSRPIAIARTGGGARANDFGTGATAFFTSLAQRVTGQTGPSPPSSQPSTGGVHQYVLCFTEDRWKMFAKLQFGNTYIEKACVIWKELVNRLTPEAYELKLKNEKQREEDMRVAEELKKAKEEERKRLEEEKKRLEEEQERERQLQEPTQIIVEANANSGEMVVDQHSTPESSLETVPAAEHAAERTVVNINGSGIDVSFLEALPDELRLEVLNQHFRERELSNIARSVPESSALNTEFLDALPFEIREEIIRQERLEQEQQESRQRALNTNVQSTAGSAPEATLRSAVGEASSIGSLSGAKAKLSASTRESIQLVDSHNVACLLRLVFVPETGTKEALYNLLGNLCENSRTRTELIGMLISVLSAGNTDLASVDRTFSHLTLKNTSSKAMPIREESISTTRSSTSSVGGEFVPNLVANRCLEALTHLTSSVGSVGKYFLTETENPTSLVKTLKLKRSKGKEKGAPVPLVCPVVFLLNLLQQPSLLNSSVALEKLMHLLTNVLRPLSHIAKRKYSEASKGTKSLSTQEDTTAAAGGQDEMNQDEQAANTVQDASSGAEDKKKEKQDIKLPVFPESSICGVVKVLRDGTSSSKSFQYTLSVIQYLSSYPSHLAIIIKELLNSAQALGDMISTEIDELLEILGRVETMRELHGLGLEKFTSVGATQAKFLRTLKTIDYLFSKANDFALNHAYLTGISVFADVKAGAQLVDMQVLNRLYDTLKLSTLWQKLGNAMSIIDGKNDLIHVGTVLLPFIEAFMVVSKPKVTFERRQQIQAGISVSRLYLKQHAMGEESHAEANFLLFAEENKRVLNTMVRNNPSLMNGSFSLLVQNPKALEFDNKRTYFTQQLHKSPKRNVQPVQINVRRKYVFEESYQQLQGKTGDAIKYGKLNVRFRGEEGVDAGGVTREWFSALGLQMFNPDYALFRPSAADKVTYQPNRASGINPDHLFYFKFVGRIIGKAIYDGRLLDAHFTRSFYKCMVSSPVDHKDMEAIDPEFYKSLDWILNNDITDILDLTFSIDVDDFGRQKVIDLKENGRNIAVTQENKHEYVKLVTEQRLVVAIKDQVEAFLAGFHEIIPKDLIRIFNEQELELLISGLPEIDIDDWKNNTEYQNYTTSSPQIQWFWRAVRSFTQEERAKLIQFATGTSKVPLGGFTKLQGSSGIQKFQIHKEFSSNLRLPSAHTCFNQIDLPQYDSYEQLRSFMLVAINESEGFGFA